MSETSSVSESQAVEAETSTDSRARSELEEMQAAIDAERAERAAREVAPPQADPGAPIRAEPLGLSVRTSALSEFRDSGGRLQAFELNGRTSFGALCAALSRMPGVEFSDHQARAWFRRPSRFTFRGQLYEVGVPYGIVSVYPANRGAAILDMEELLDYVRRNVLKLQKSRFITAELNE